jgi:hypothetical protein
LQNPENIFLVPLLVNQKYPSGLIFQIIKDETCVAKGGRFENIIRRFNRKNKSRSKKSFTISAVEISFNVESILSLFQTSSLSDEITRGMDVVIFAQQKSMAIPVSKHYKTRNAVPVMVMKTAKISHITLLISQKNFKVSNRN